MFCKDKTSFIWSRLLKLCNNNKESSLNSSFLLFIYFLIKCTALKVSFTWSMNNGWRMKLCPHIVLCLMDKLLFALHTKLLCLNHQQSFGKPIVKVETANAIYLIHIAICATKVAGANIVSRNGITTIFGTSFRK